MIRRAPMGRLWAAFLLLVAGCASVTEHSSSQVFHCNCAWYAYVALKNVGVRLETMPALVQTDEIRQPGRYAKGVMYVKNVDDCRTVMHELVHHAQRLRHGDGRDIHEWQRRENQAALVAKNAESETTCEDAQR